MSDLTPGAGIKILDQAVALITLLGRARDALVLADQLEPKIKELWQIKGDLGLEIDALSREKAGIIAKVEAEQDKIIADRASELAVMEAKAAKEAADQTKKLQDRLDSLNLRIETNTKELEILETVYKERSFNLAAEISSAETRLAKMEKKIAEMKAI